MADSSVSTKCSWRKRARGVSGMREWGEFWLMLPPLQFPQSLGEVSHWWVSMYSPPLSLFFLSGSIAQECIYSRNGSNTLHHFHEGKALCRHI